MPDQLRSDFLSCYGADFIETPNIDSIAAGGVRYADACSPSPVCVPARSVILSGVNAIRTGVLKNGNFLRPDMGDYGMRTWPELLNEAGYETAAIGKMHFYPWDISMGFQHRVICEDKRWIYIEDDYQHYLARHGLRKLHGNEHEGYYENKGAVIGGLPWEHSWDYFVGEEAVKFVRSRTEPAASDGSSEKPFALMVGFPGPHCPYDPSPGFDTLFDPGSMPDPAPEAEDQPPGFREADIRGKRSAWNGVDYTEFTIEHKKKIRAHYAGLVKQIDEKVGDILNALEDTGQIDNTIIIFSSDHGDYLGDHGLTGKGTFYEGSIKVPLLVRLPERSETKTWEDPVSIEDITATILSLGGCDIPGYFDSRLLPGLGIDGDSVREEVYGFLAGGCMIYDGRWKLAKYAGGIMQLFDTEIDPHEQENRIDDPECHAMYRRLDSKLTAEMLRSIYRANDEKRVRARWDDRDFARRGWKRRYPQPI